MKWEVMYEWFLFFLEIDPLHDTKDIFITQGLNLVPYNSATILSVNKWYPNNLEVWLRPMTFQLTFVNPLDALCMIVYYGWEIWIFRKPI